VTKPFAPVAAVILACAFAAPAPAAADATNRNLLPFGERAAMLGNAGITSPNGEAVFYNPANLARITHPKLSVSGTTYLLYQLSADPILVLDGQDQSYDASGFVAIPSTVISTYQLGPVSLATAVLVPEALALRNRATFEGTDTRATVLQKQEQQQLALGVGGGLAVADGLFVGLSVFVINSTENAMQFSRVQIGLVTPTQIVEQTTNRDTSVFGLSAVAGIEYQRGRLSIGARVHSPSIKLRGKGDFYESVLQAGDEDGTSEVALEGVAVDDPIPLDAGLGLAVQATDTLIVMADFNLQMPATVTKVDDPRLPTEEQELELAPRGSLGVEWEAWPAKRFRAGFLINRGATKTPQTEADTSRENYLGATAGFAWSSGRTETALGAFYLHGDVEMVVGGSTPPRYSDARGRLFGALLSISYRL
jgi:hypothetical protein